MSNLRHIKAKYSHLGYTLGRQVKRKKAGSKKGVGSKTIYSYFFKRERGPLVNQYLHIYSFSIIPDFGYLATTRTLKMPHIISEYAI